MRFSPATLAQPIMQRYPSNENPAPHPLIHAPVAEASRVLRAGLHEMRSRLNRVNDKFDQNINALDGIAGRMRKCIDVMETGDLDAMIAMRDDLRKRQA